MKYVWISVICILIFGCISASTSSVSFGLFGVTLFCLLGLIGVWMGYESAHVSFQRTVICVAIAVSMVTIFANGYDIIQAVVGGAAIAGVPFFIGTEVGPWFRSIFHKSP